MRFSTDWDCPVCGHNNPPLVAGQDRVDKTVWRWECQRCGNVERGAGCPAPSRRAGVVLHRHCVFRCSTCGVEVVGNRDDESHEYCATCDDWMDWRLKEEV